MKKTLTIYDMAREMSDDFSWSAAMALAEWLEDLDEDCGTDTEFDSVAIRCDFSEYESLEEWADDYFADRKQMDEDEIRDYIHDHGTLIEFDGGIVVSSF